MGLKTHAPLHLMLQRKRPIPKKYLPHFIKSLNLSPLEGIYLENLLEYQRAKNPQSKELYAQRLADLSPRGMVKMQEVDAYRYLKDPLHCLILEMTSLRGFQSDLHWIKKRISEKHSLHDIKIVLERLFHLGLLKKDEQGNFVKTHQHITSVPDVHHQGVQEYHQNVAKLASDAVVAQPLAEREFNAYAFNIKATSLPRAKEMIRKFSSDFIREIEAEDGLGEETFQLNIQFFRLTKKGAKK